MKVETKNVATIMRIIVATINTMLTYYCLSVLLLSKLLVYDKPVVRTAIVLLLVIVFVNACVLQSKVRSYDELMHKYSDVVHIRKQDFIALIICMFTSFALGFYFNHCAKGYMFVYAPKVKDVLINANFAPTYQLLFCSLPTWLITPLLSPFYIDLVNMHGYIFPGLFFGAFASITMVYVQRSVLFQNNLLRFKENDNNGVNN